MDNILIAELCQNHNGDFNLVRDMVDAAVDAGATHIKIQHIHVKNLTMRPQFEEGFVSGGETLSIKRPFKAEFDRLKKLELSSKDSRDFVEYVKSKGAVPMTTCFSRDTISTLVEEGYECIKVASYDCASFAMIRELADNFKELIISTGATFDDEIGYTADLLNSKGTKFSLLHCVTIYPTPLEEMHLSRMEELKKYGGGIGFSDHSLVERDGVLASKAALALGASVIERHFTILEKDETKDGPVSIKPAHLKELRRFSELDKDDQIAELNETMPDWRSVLSGNKDRSLSKAELLNRSYYRGRFASPRVHGEHRAEQMIFNWEETPVHN